MQSSNPVFARSAEFNGTRRRRSANDPSQWQIDLNGESPTHTELGRGTGRMTIDTVIEKTAITLRVLVCRGGHRMGPHRRHGPTHGERRLERDALRSLGGASAVSSCRWSTRSRRSSARALVLAYAARGGRVRRRLLQGRRRRILAGDAEPHLRRGPRHHGCLRRHAGGLQVLQHPGRRPRSARSSSPRCSASSRVSLLRLRPAVLRQELRLQRLRHDGPDLQRHRRRASPCSC